MLVVVLLLTLSLSMYDGEFYDGGGGGGGGGPVAAAVAAVAAVAVVAVVAVVAAVEDIYWGKRLATKALKLHDGM